jgi:diguanylate cyclase (GGDEF)-like protein
LQNETDFSILDEITRLNNELITVQRDLAKKNMELERLYAAVQNLSIRDSLTGVYNRRGLYNKGEQEVEHAKRYRRPLAVIMFDFDRVKGINDCFGHSVGDQVVVETVQRIGRQLRKTDVLGRFGGDEFVILLPETPLDGAAITAERLRTAVNNSMPVNGSLEMVNISISMGLAIYQENTADFDALLLCADRAMYQAKNAGGNRVCVDRGAV